MAELVKTPLGDKLQASQQQNRPRSGEAKEDVIFRKIEELFASMSDLMKKVRVDGLPQKHEELATEFGRLKRVRQETNQEWKLAIHTERTRAEKYKTGKTICDQIQASESRVLEVVSALGATKSPDIPEVLFPVLQELKNEVKAQRDVLKQVGEGLTEIQRKNETKWCEVACAKSSLPGASQADPEGGQMVLPTVHPRDKDESNSGWSDAVKRKPAKKIVDPPQNQKEQTKLKPRSRPPAIMVDVSREEFPALAKRIRENANREVIGDHVVGMRQSRTGGLILEVRGSPAELEAVKAEVVKTSGSSAGVRSLESRATCEIRDLDEWSTKEEVTAAIATATGVSCESVKVFSLRKQYGGTQAANASMDSGSAKKLVSGGRLRVGLVSCRVRMAEERLRCFQCLSFGHIAKECKGPDRAGCCWSCGEGGHNAASCSAAVEAMMAFGKVLAESKGGDKAEVQKDSFGVAETSSASQ